MLYVRYWIQHNLHQNQENFVHFAGYDITKEYDLFQKNKFW